LRLLNEDETAFLPVIHDKEIQYFGLADSLKEAIHSFLINNVIRTIRRQPNKHRSMMINITRYNKVQTQIHYRVSEYIDLLKNAIEELASKTVEKFISDKELNKIYNMTLASKGFTVFSMSYTLWPEATVPIQLMEIAEALSWINSHLSSYPCDSKKILLTGDSAGGQLALFSAVLAESSVLRGVFSVKDCGLKITCLGLVSPVPDMSDSPVVSVYTKKMWGKNYASSPTSRYMNFKDISKFSKLPPTVLITSSGDTLAEKQTITTYNRIKDLGVKTELYNYGKVDGKHLPHVFSVIYPQSNEGMDAIENMLNFFKETF
jgi:acetyl esterase/lipase